MCDHQKANTLLSKMLKKTLAADVEILAQTAERIYRDANREPETTNDYKIVGVTADNRVAELIEEVAGFLNADPAKPEKFDMVVYTLSTGSPDYIEWVKNQTEVVDSSESAFNDINPDDLYKKDFGKAPEAGAMVNTKIEETAVVTKPNMKILQESENVQTAVNNNQEEDDDEDEEED